MLTITDKYYFKIATNSVGQRVLIVGDDYRSFVYEPVPFEAFDAIFFETEDSMILKRQIGSMTSARRNPNYTFKPFFFKPTITSKTALVFADGLCLTIEDQVLIQETKRINSRFKALEFKIYDRDISFWTPENRIFHIFRTYLLRSDDLPEWQLKRDSSLGYAIPRLELLLKLKVVTVKDTSIFDDKFCFQHKLFKQVALKAIVHCCPKCYENKIIWQELCPKCGTMDIDEVNMIHHFRCANISAEHTYINDGKLTCPKCKHELKHIGVDYDRPASMYNCMHDNTLFSTPITKALCSNCASVSDVSELKRVKLYKLDFTHHGRTTFAQFDHVQDSDNVPKLPSIHTYNSFLYAIKVRVNIARNNGDLYPVVFRLRVTPEDNLEMIDNVVIHRIYKLYPNAVISYKNNTFYMLQLFPHEITADIVEEILPLKEFNRNNEGYTFDGDYIELDVNMDIDSIIASI